MLQRIEEDALGRRPVEELVRAAVADQVDADHQSDATHVADERVLLLHGAQAIQHVRADPCRVLDETLVDDRFERGERRGRRERVAAVAR